MPAQNRETVHTERTSDEGSAYGYLKPRKPGRTAYGASDGEFGNRLSGTIGKSKE